MDEYFFSNYYLKLNLCTNSIVLKDDNAFIKIQYHHLPNRSIRLQRLTDDY